MLLMPITLIRAERTITIASPSLVLAISLLVDDFPVTNSIPVSLSFQRLDPRVHLLLNESIAVSEGWIKPRAWTITIRPTGPELSLYNA